jgi:transposase
MKNGVLSGKLVDHLGLVAGCYRELGISGVIDGALPKRAGFKVSDGTCVLAMILNGLGFVDRRLYLFPEYYGKIACERLLEVGDPSCLNDDVLGRTLDRISGYGATRLFNEVMYHVMTSMGIDTRLVHVDTTSFSLAGEYKEEGESCFKIGYGFPKDGRWDLKRYVLGLACNQDGLPLFMKSFSGNKSDYQGIREVVDGLRSGLLNGEKVYYVADSSFYGVDNIRGLGLHTFWICRVPSFMLEAKRLFERLWPMRECEDRRYSFYETLVEYAGVVQKWVLVRSEYVREKGLANFERELAKQREAAEKGLWHLSNKLFESREIASKAAEKWIEAHPLFEFESLDFTVVRKKKVPKQGGFREGDEVVEYYRVKARLRECEEEVERRKALLGRFIIASNDVDASAESLIIWYRDRNKVEHGFRFLKDDTFNVSDVYLKSPRRIQALSMIMVLSLLIYNMLEWKLRRRLQEEGKTVRNQVKKQVQNPTMKWIFYLFMGIIEIRQKDKKRTTAQLINMTDEQQQILDLLGPAYEKYYS